MKILITSHGEFAKGLKDTAEQLFHASNVYSACVTEGSDINDFKKEVKEMLDAWGDEQVVICSDTKAGSDNQADITFLDRPNTFLISGTNLAVILQLITRDSVTLDSLRDIIKMAQLDVDLINDALAGADSDEDE